MVSVRKLTVGLGERAYDILIGEGTLGGLQESIAPFRSHGPAAIVTDENVWDALGEKVPRTLLGEAGPIILPPGEEMKSLNGLSFLYESFARARVTRETLVVAFGGGVVGDLCGFAAATWMRGVRLAQVPTTLLAQVDSSVGGKTAINIPSGKNLAGAFHQPSVVVIDTDALRSLPRREMRSGMAEVVKYGAIRSRWLFDALSGGAPPGMMDVIHECCRIKAEIVSRDELDRGERALLNFGHTFGHAIEMAEGFGKYRHGEAVAFGMVMAAHAGERLGVTEPGTGARLRRALAALGLETDYRGDAADLLPAVRADKKSCRDSVTMIFLRHVGEAFARPTEFSELKAAMEADL
jgi:3-dehydroquinate synthase